MARIARSMPQCSLQIITWKGTYMPVTGKNNHHKCLLKEKWEMKIKAWVYILCRNYCMYKDRLFRGSKDKFHCWLTSPAITNRQFDDRSSSSGPTNDLAEKEQKEQKNRTGRECNKKGKQKLTGEESMNTWKFLHSEMDCTLRIHLHISCKKVHSVTCQIQPGKCQVLTLTSGCRCMRLHARTCTYIGTHLYCYS